MTAAYVPQAAYNPGEEPYPEAVAGEVVDYAPQRMSSVQRALLANIKSVNIAKGLTDNELAAIGSKVVEEYELDEQSREAAGWNKRNEQALKLAMQVKEAKTYPWVGAANIKYPLITVAAIQFNARAYPAIVDGSSVVKGKVLGEPSDEKRDRADRIARHMSYQLLEEMDGWEEGTDQLLIMLPVVGTMIRKTWFDPVSKHNCSRLISPDKFVVNYWAQGGVSVPRMTHVLDDVYPYQIEEKVRAGQWLAKEYGDAENSASDDQAPHTFLEQHRLIDLDGDGYPEPYIVTVHRETQFVCRIVARYDETGVSFNEAGEVSHIEPVGYFTKYGFIPSMDGSWYDIGFGDLLGDLGETINTGLNQLTDAGHLANVQGGFIGGNVSIKAGSQALRPGEWRKIEASGPSLKDNIVPLPVKEPSSVLYNLMLFLIESAKDITATKDILTGETQGQNQPVGTTLATIEQGLKVFTAIYKRIHRALKGEFRALFRLNSLYLDEQAYFNFQDEQGVVARQDYAEGDCDVMPVSDPTVVTDMQRVARAQYLGQFLGKGLNDQVIIKRMLEAGSIPDTKELMPEGPPPPDPALLLETEKVNVEKAKVLLENRKLDQLEHGHAREDHKTGVADVQTAAQVAKTMADTEKTTTETMLLAPQFMLQVRQMVADQMAQLMAANESQDGETGTVQPGNVRGMEGVPPDQALPGLSQGQPDPLAGGLGPGPVVGPGPAGEGAADGGAGVPGMG